MDARRWRPFPVNVYRLIRLGPEGGPKTSHGEGFRQVCAAASRLRERRRCPAFSPRRTNLTAAPLWRLGSWAAPRSARSFSLLLTNQSSIGLRREQSRIGRSDHAGAADSARRQGKPERDPTTGLSHRYAQQRSRPALLQGCRPRAGARFRDRGHRAASSCVAVAASEHRPHRYKSASQCKRGSARQPFRPIAGVSSLPSAGFDGVNGPGRHRIG